MPVPPQPLALHVLRFAPGRSQPVTLDDVQEFLYVVSGAGSLYLAVDEHTLEPDTAALLLPGDTYEIETDPGIEVISVSAPAGSPVVRERVTLRYADCAEQRADEDRTFRVLFETDVTQFVGLVQPSRAPDHSHPYDEVGYIIEGHGFAHLRGESRPIGPGSTFHLPPGLVHCIENSGPDVMRILGVFHPSGSPAQRGR